jgi:hypothetical protein
MHYTSRKSVGSTHAVALSAEEMLMDEDLEAHA